MLTKVIFSWILCVFHFPMILAEFTLNDCYKDVQQGPRYCNRMLLVYMWNHEEQQCIPTIYGGCNPSPNNFQTKEECDFFARPVCQKPSAEYFTVDDCEKGVEEGPVSCRAYIPVYKWDEDKGKCVEAIYGGCDKTRNNFETKDDCEWEAKPVCLSPFLARADCVRGAQKTQGGCRGGIPVYRWDHTAQQCVIDFFGGCHKTRNNFKRREDCEMYARPICDNLFEENEFLDSLKLLFRIRKQFKVVLNT